MERSLAEASLLRAEGARVVVLGDVMLDRYVRGDTQRLSPEAPVPVVLVDDEFDRLGGAANVARNLKALGAEPMLLGVVGDDDPGDRFMEVLADEGIDTAGMAVEPGRVTGVKTRVVCRGQQVVRVDRETTAPVTSATAHKLTEALGEAADGAVAVLFSDYGKGVLDPQHVPGFLATTPEGVYTCVDPVPYRMQHYAGIAAATPNEREGRAALNLPPWEAIRDHELARRIFERFRFEELFVTLGERGLVWVDREHGPNTVATRPRQVFDVSGAGDTVVAMLGLMRGLGVAPATAAELANLAAGLVVEKVGTATVSPAEILAAL